MVGDDVDAMTREIVEQREPVVDTLIAGFNGGAHYGYEHVLADIFKSVYEVKQSELNKNPKLVNIFGIIPEKDPYWQGNLEEIKRILKGVGIETNVFFGAEGGLEDIDNARNASLSITFGRWGELPARVLSEKFDIPVIQKAALPVNAAEEKELIEEIGNVISLEQDLVDDFLNKEFSYESSYYGRIRDEVIELGFGKSVAIVGDEEQVIRLGRIAKDIFGANVVAAVLTDSLKKDEEHELNNSELLSTITNNVYKTSDQKDIDDIIRQAKAEIIIGRSLESNVAKKAGIPLVEASYPIYHKSILNQPAAGVRGAVSFVSDYLTTEKEAQKEKSQVLYGYLKLLKEHNSWQEHSTKKGQVKQLNLISELASRESI